MLFIFALKKYTIKMLFKLIKVYCKTIKFILKSKYKKISQTLFMEKVTTLFLKIAVILLGVPVLAWCIFGVPEMANLVAKLLPEFAFIKYLVFIAFDAPAIPFYFALYQAFKLLRYIDENKAYSDLSVKALKKIQYYAITCGRNLM